jgi:hypothetical protein
VGEILLVMIGILMALQVNNWNEERKERGKEQKILSEILETMEENINLLDSTIIKLYDINLSGELILDVWEKKLPYSDSLQWHFFKSTWDGYQLVIGISSAGYEGLKNAGLDVIINDSLRKHIVQVFEKTIPKLQSRFESNRQANLLHMEYFKKNFYWGKTGNSEYSGLVPFDYNKLLTDNYYYSIIQHYDVSRRHFIDVTSVDMQELKKVRHMILDEIVNNH